jgi:hypothetical protein
MDRRGFLGVAGSVFAFPFVKASESRVKRTVIVGGCRSGKSTMGYNHVRHSGWLLAFCSYHAEHLSRAFDLSGVKVVTPLLAKELLEDDSFRGDRLWIDEVRSSVYGSEFLYDFSSRFRSSVWVTFPNHDVPSNKFYKNADEVIRTRLGVYDASRCDRRFVRGVLS